MRFFLTDIAVFNYLKWFKYPMNILYVLFFLMGDRKRKNRENGQ